MILVEDLDLLFVHVPQTGGTAIRRYLVEHHGGVQVAPMHQVWEQVVVDLADPGRLRVMTAIRHPMDQTVSSYRKLVTDHRHQISRGVAGPRRLEQHAFIAGQQADFEAWFLRYRTRVFSPRWLGSVRRSTWVLRFETLEHDFEAALVEAGVHDPAPLPRVNATARHGDAFADAFTSEAARRRAATVFGPFMADVGYQPPDGWPWRIPRWASWEYAVGHRARTARAVGLHGAAARLTRPHA